MVRVGKRGRERVVQHRRGFVEIDPMLLGVGGGFPGIPLENHNSVYAVESAGIGGLTLMPTRIK